MTNHSFFGKLSWPQIVDRSSKIVNFYDLGGSEKALKSSVRQLNNVLARLKPYLLTI